MPSWESRKVCSMKFLCSSQIKLVIIERFRVLFTSHCLFCNLYVLLISQYRSLDLLSSIYPKYSMVVINVFQELTRFSVRDNMD